MGEEWGEGIFSGNLAEGGWFWEQLNTGASSGGMNENQCAGLEGWETLRVPWSPSHLGYWLFAIAVRGTSGAMAPPAHPPLPTGGAAREGGW